MGKTRTITESQSDSFLKELFSHRTVLANLLHFYVPEFSEVDIETIVDNCILPIGTTERIQTNNTDYYVNDTHFDLVFHVRPPNAANKQDRLIINLEFQNNLNPHCKIIKRGIYYSSCLLVDEKEKLFQDSHYEDLKKVYSIWICPNSPNSIANSIHYYDISEHLNGDSAKSLIKRKAHDLIEMKLIFLNKIKLPTLGTGFHLLHTLINSPLTPQERADILEQHYSIVFNKEKFEMYDIIKDHEDFARKEGRREGRREGRKEGLKEGENVAYFKSVKRMLDKGVSPEQIREYLGLTQEQLDTFNHKFVTT